jgi:hypothetical protein
LSKGEDLNVYGPFQLLAEAGSMQLVGHPFPLVLHIMPTEPFAWSTGAGLESPHCEQFGRLEQFAMSIDVHGPSKDVEWRMLVGP